MLQSSPKRRKVSPDASITVDQRDINAAVRSQPTTPTRASYASPTKASLARSHPNILALSPTRRKTRSERGRNLREEILGFKNGEDLPVSQSERPGQVAKGVITGTQARPDGPSTEDTSRGSSHAAMTRAFEAAREPLAVRQPRASRVTRGASVGSLDDLPGIIQPKLVDRPTKPPASSRLKSNEPDLPPTSVQLGIDLAPDRPRGLASSSSPRSSRSGSGRRRRRIRSGSVTSSPLKPKANIPPPSTINAEPAEEAPESEAEEAPELPSTLLEEIKEKEFLHDGLTQQLKRLKIELGKLERAANSPSTGQHLDVDPELFSLLTSRNPSCALEPSTDVDSLPHFGHFASKEHPLPYLTLFAPGNLVLVNKTSTKTVRGHVQTIHDVVIHAPPPWPAQSYSISLEIVVNSEKVVIEAVRFKAPRTWLYSDLITRHPSLQQWLKQRIDHTLHRFDFGCLIWGIGEHLDECIRRARAFAELERRFRTKENDETSEPPPLGDAALTEADVKTLLPFLAQSRFEIPVESSMSPDEEKGNKRKRGRPPASGKKVLLLWGIDLDWTGSASSTVELVTDGVSAKAQDNVKNIFGTLSEKSGVVAAVEHVVELLKRP